MRERRRKERREKKERRTERMELKEKEEVGEKVSGKSSHGPSKFKRGASRPMMSGGEGQPCKNPINA